MPFSALQGDSNINSQLSHFWEYNHRPDVEILNEICGPELAED